MGLVQQTRVLVLGVPMRLRQRVWGAGSLFGEAGPRKCGVKEYEEKDWKRAATKDVESCQLQGQPDSMSPGTL